MEVSYCKKPLDALNIVTQSGDHSRRNIGFQRAIPDTSPNDNKPLQISRLYRSLDFIHGLCVTALSRDNKNKIEHFPPGQFS